MRRSQAGQATIEWSALLLALAFALRGAHASWSRERTRGASGSASCTRSSCAVDGGCDERDSLDLAYGDELADAVRRHAPNVVYERRSAALPIDFRRCRETDCSDGPDAARAIDRSRSGLPVTAFTRVVDRRGDGGALYLQYWFYFPESFTGGIGRIFGDDWPGFHPDDWEGYQVRVSPGGAVTARATAHGEYASGWSESAGLVPRLGRQPRRAAGRGAARRARHARRRSSTLVPLERLGSTGRYTFAVTPPWRKEVYTQPESASS